MTAAIKYHSQTDRIVNYARSVGYLKLSRNVFTNFVKKYVFKIITCHVLPLCIILKKNNDNNNNNNNNNIIIIIIEKKKTKKKKNKQKKQQLYF